MKYHEDMPRKVRDLIRDVTRAGFSLVPGGGKGSHRKFVHRDYPGVVTITGHEGDDAKRYQERAVRKALEETQE